MDAVPTILSNYSKVIKPVISQGDVLCQNLVCDPGTANRMLNKLGQSVPELGVQTQRWGDDVDGQFLSAAGDMQAGYILFAAGSAVKTGQSADIQSVLDELKAEQAVIDSAGTLLSFEPDLLKISPLPSNNQEMLALFQSRTYRTLDNMVLETRDVISSAVKKFKKDFDAFAKALPDLLDSISAQIPSEAVRAGLEKIISGLKSLGQFLHSRALQEAIPRECIRLPDAPKTVARVLLPKPRHPRLLDQATSET